MQISKTILSSILILSLFSQSAFAFLPLGADNIIIQNIQSSGGPRQGTYNQTLANNSPVNIGGYKLNFINGTGNPIILKNSTNGMVNVTIGLASSMGVSSLNALTGALTIACVSGNTTCTTSGGNTITVNTAYNIGTTGLSAQTITKALTINNLILGGQMNINGQTFQSGGHTYSWPANTGTVCLTNQTGSCGTSSGSSTYDTMVNIGTGQASVYAGNTTKTNFQFKTIKQGANIAITNNTSDVTIAVTGLLSSAITSINSDSTAAQKIIRQLGNTTVTNSSGTITIGFGVNPVITGGSAQTFSKNLDFGGGTTDKFASSGIIIRNPATTFATTITNAAITANRTLNLPLITGSDTLGALGMVQSWTGNNTMKFGAGGIIIRNPASTFTTTIEGSAQTANRTIALPVTTQNEILAIRPAINSSTPNDPAGTTSTTGVMTGLVIGFTPNVTGRVQIIIEGDLASSAAADGVKVDARYGTGGSPANAAALTGTVCGKAVQLTAAAVSANRIPFALTCQVTGLTIGTHIWVELGQYAITAGTATVTNISATVMEI